MKLYCGTSGFSFKEWKGPFYPEKLPAGDMLPHYAERLPAVEINNTFYRMPRPAMIDGWTDKVPETFRFAIKSPRFITHSRQLKGCEELVESLLKTLKRLGPRMGIILFQLPPHARASAENLDTFLNLIPDDVATAFEFRHDSWANDEVYSVLRKHRSTWVLTDNDGLDVPDFPDTSDTAYLRLRATAYSDQILEAWCKRCEGFETAFVFFKHEDGGAAPRFAERMLEQQGAA